MINLDMCGHSKPRFMTNRYSTGLANDSRRFFSYLHVNWVPGCLKQTKNGNQHLKVSRTGQVFIFRGQLLIGYLYHTSIVLI